MTDKKKEEWEYRVYCSEGHVCSGSSDSQDEAGQKIELYIEGKLKLGHSVRGAILMGPTIFLTRMSKGVWFNTSGDILPYGMKQIEVPEPCSHDACREHVGCVYQKKQPKEKSDWSGAKVTIVGGDFDGAKGHVT